MKILMREVTLRIKVDAECSQIFGFAEILSHQFAARGFSHTAFVVYKRYYFHG
jgi:hypothetical protein